LRGAPPTTGSGLSVVVTTKSTPFDGVGVGVKVLVTVGVKVFVGVGVNVSVAVGVKVSVAVGVSVFVGVGVKVFVGVGVSVSVGVLLAVAVAVGASTVVTAVAELFASLYSGTMPAGSTVAVLLTDVSAPVVTEPVIVTIARAPAPVPKAPRSQSSVPPVLEPTMAQLPLVVEKFA
jgi:hypothetical protein